MKDLTGKEFGGLLVVERDTSYKGNNVKYIVKCRCGRLFSARAYHLKTLFVTQCPFCAKEKTKQRQAQYRANRRIVGREYPCDEIKYTLMDKKKTKILTGTMGRYLFFDLKKARTATRNIYGGATVVPLTEAEAIKGGYEIQKRGFL